MTTFVINWMAMQLFTLDRKTPEVLDVDIHSWGIILRSKSIFWILVTMHLKWDYNSLHNYIWIDHRLKILYSLLALCWWWSKFIVTYVCPVNLLSSAIVYRIQLFLWGAQLTDWYCLVSCSLSFQLFFFFTFASWNKWINMHCQVHVYCFPYCVNWPGKKTTELPVEYVKNMFVYQLYTYNRSVKIV